jgi:hypothetical protein
MKYSLIKNTNFASKSLKSVSGLKSSLKVFSNLTGMENKQELRDFSEMPHHKTFFVN